MTPETTEKREVDSQETDLGFDKLTKLPAFEERVQGGEQKEKIKDYEIRHLSEKDDLGRAGELLFQVDPYIFPDFLGDEERAKKLGPALFSPENGGLFSFDRTLVAEQDGKLVGILCYRTSEVKPWDSEAVTERFKETGVELPENFERANESYMKKITDAELPEGSAEIEFLATAPEARGQGIGTGLIKQLKESGQFDTLHLDVLGDNEGAIRVYERAGFSTTYDFPSYPDGAITVHHMECPTDTTLEA